MKAVVMAGGEGTRLRPLTSNQPKPMVPIVGKPCIEHILELLKRHGLNDVIVTVAFLPQAIRTYFGDGETLGMQIGYSVEESPAGTAGSVRLASDRLDETFVVISGDALCDIDLTALVEFHKQKGAAVTIGLKSVDNPLEFGIVVTDDQGKVERFLEKPSWGQVFSDTINTGIYVLDPEVLKHIPADRPFDFSKELFPLLLEMGRPIYGKVCEGYWQDIGNLDQYRQANYDALDEKVQLNIPGIRLRGNLWIGETVDIDDLERVEGPAFIGNYCRISPGATVGAYSVLGPSVTLRERARTARSIVDASTYIGRNALIEGAIIGRSCDIRSHVRVHEGVAIGDEVSIGAESVISAGVRIYPFKEVESGSQIYESLIWESRASSRMFNIDGVAGLVNVDLTPETAVRIAAALGTALKRGARVVASRESPAACRMIKRAMLAGLTSTGIDVSDLRTIPAAVSRHFLKAEGYDAGFHVGTSQSDPEVVQIRFFEPPGIMLTPRAPEGRREALCPPRAAARRRLGRGRHHLPRARSRELRAGSAEVARRCGDPRTGLPAGRGLRLLRGFDGVATRARAARRRVGLGARVCDRRGSGGGADDASWVDRAGEAPGRSGGGRFRCRDRPCRGAALSDRRGR